MMVRTKMHACRARPRPMVDLDAVAGGEHRHLVQVVDQRRPLSMLHEVVVYRGQT